MKDPAWNKVAYVAGPYRADSLRGVVDNVRAAEYVALKWWRLGYAVICPHLNSYLFEGVMTIDEISAGNMELLKRADILVMVPGWKHSENAKKKHDFALQEGILIVYED